MGREQSGWYAYRRLLCWYLMGSIANYLNQVMYAREFTLEKQTKGINITDRLVKRIDYSLPYVLGWLKILYSVS